MEKGFLDKVEDNAAVQAWSKTTQHEKGDSLAKGYILELWDFTCISVTQNSLQELKKIWNQWNEEVRQLFNSNYGDLPYLLDIKWVAARIKQKGDSKCIPWKNLKDIILADPDMKKRVDVFALSMYGLVVFPKALRHVDEVVTDLFDRLDRGLHQSRDFGRKIQVLNACRRVGEDEILYRCDDFDWVPLLGI
ncbi:hypothetical protein Goshw_015193 [Gossypium schwendimanii]|uniref:Uncharacterized protein n=1 Tax=Gossypium schwendimanii TaxID=34291 RepID=A0A7J9MQ62_GOSSC|nr:hypothetical protein [Gossypium schwendimanii]